MIPLFRSIWSLFELRIEYNGKISKQSFGSWLFWKGFRVLGAWIKEQRDWLQEYVSKSGSPTPHHLLWFRFHVFFPQYFSHVSVNNSKVSGKNFFFFENKDIFPE